MPESPTEGEPQFRVMNERSLGTLTQCSAFVIKGAWSLGGRVEKSCHMILDLGKSRLRREATTP